MKRNPVIYLFLMLISQPAYSDAIGDVVKFLGVSTVQFGDLWTNSCSPDFEIELPASVLDNDTSVVKSGIEAGFMTSEKLESQKILIKKGPVCEALVRYYFDNESNESLIESFVEKDSEFKSIFGFSSIDAWGIQKYASSSMNGKIDQFKLAHWRVLDSKGLIQIRVEDATFNGNPSKAYFSTATTSGESLNRALQKTIP